MNTNADSDKAALLVMVHGSPKLESNAPMFAVVDMIRESAEYSVVEVGFMECNEPSIPDAIESCIAQGVSTVVAVPYFLHVGTHVADDLPTLLEEAQAKYPNVMFKVGQYLGQSPEITKVLAARAWAALQK